jgi:hypothetical protein
VLSHSDRRSKHHPALHRVCRPRTRAIRHIDVEWRRVDVTHRCGRLNRYLRWSEGGGVHQPHPCRCLCLTLWRLEMTVRRLGKSQRRPTPLLRRRLAEATMRRPRPRVTVSTFLSVRVSARVSQSTPSLIDCACWRRGIHRTTRHGRSGRRIDPVRRSDRSDHGQRRCLRPQTRSTLHHLIHILHIIKLIHVIVISIIRIHSSRCQPIRRDDLIGFLCRARCESRGSRWRARR